MTGVRGDPLSWARGRIKEAAQTKIDEACGYRAKCIDDMRADGAAMTKAPAATAPAPKQPDVAAGMMGGMGGS